MNDIDNGVQMVGLPGKLQILNKRDTNLGSREIAETIDIEENQTCDF